MLGVARPVARHTRGRTVDRARLPPPHPRPRSVPFRLRRLSLRPLRPYPVRLRLLTTLVTIPPWPPWTSRPLARRRPLRLRPPRRPWSRSTRRRPRPRRPAPARRSCRIRSIPTRSSRGGYTRRSCATSSRRDRQPTCSVRRRRPVRRSPRRSPRRQDVRGHRVLARAIERTVLAAVDAGRGRLRLDDYRRRGRRTVSARRDQLGRCRAVDPAVVRLHPRHRRRQQCDDPDAHVHARLPGAPQEQAARGRQGCVGASKRVSSAQACRARVIASSSRRSSRRPSTSTTRRRRTSMCARARSMCADRRSGLATPASSPCPRSTSWSVRRLPS